MGRFFDALNTPIAVLVVLVVVAAVNVFLYLGYHASVTPSAPATERSGGPQRTIETTERSPAPEEPTRLQRRSTRPATTFQSTIPSEQSATPGASASATSSPSP